MKRILFIFISCYVVILFAGNADELNLTKDFNAYFKVIDKVESVDEYLFPDLFKIFPKATIQMAVKDMFEDTTISTAFLDSKITEITKIVAYDGAKFATIKYAYTLKLTFLAPDFEDNNGTITKIYKTKYGNDNVQFDATTNTYSIFLNNTMVGVLKPEYEHWKFVEAKQETKSILELLFPKKVIKQLKL